jgi:hypothetical protein
VGGRSSFFLVGIVLPAFPLRLEHNDLGHRVVDGKQLLADAMDSISDTQDVFRFLGADFVSHGLPLSKVPRRGRALTALSSPGEAMNKNTLSFKHSSAEWFMAAPLNTA